ncbi:uncharacterized protein DNG_08444 [Cephalotrichum gorgonifer]|uniref:Uncharacterized protein n=1 Tax=Cephalotrichum gorgonifer TaxID=2041049 RepID=A0AAE8N6H0_9PEZI|nr:uncharacterized protein DNG_08444 [Cephalotrichum gorgonifer]
MEAAAKQVKLLTQRILPDRPHQLSYSPDSRYRVGSEAKGPEEQIHRRLQYMTFISDGDRGVLLTRSYYDMREEPPTPSAREAVAPSQSDKKPATKMSLSDYKNKVKQKSQSPLPPARSLPKKIEDVAPRHTQERKGDSQQPEPWKRDALHSAKAGPGSRDPLSGDRPSSLPPKPPTARGPSPSPSGKKRGSDEDGTPRPAKRSKGDENGTPDEKPRGQKDIVRPRSQSDALRKKDTAPTTHDRGESKLGTNNSSSTANGRSMLKAAMSSAHNGSPNARSRAGSVNGSRPESSGSSKSTPVKAHTSTGTKSTVPPLLSPLHLSFEGTKSPPRKIDKAPRRDEQPSNHRSTLKGKPERQAATKRSKSPLMIPPLLSPTLPPFVEEELTRRKKVSAQDTDSRSPEHPRNVKKPHVASKDVEKPRREQLIVTLRYPKRMSKRVQRLLALPGKNERSGSTDPQAHPQPSQASKKRPLQSSGPPEMSGEALITATKRPRKPDGAPASKTVPTPSTPPRPPSAMSHVNTPGESTLGSSSQPTQNPSASQVPPSLNRLKQRHHRYSSLGTKLKHTRDDIAKRFPQNQLPDAEHKLSVVTGIEATLSYMIGFRSLFEVRRAERKPPDSRVWRSLVPFVTELQQQAKKLPFAHALILILHEAILQERLTCLYLGDLRVQGAVADLQQAGTAQFKLRGQILEVYRQVEESGLKLPALNAGVSFDEGVCKALEAMTAWAESEGLEWRASLSVDDILAAN